MSFPTLDAWVAERAGLPSPLTRRDLDAWQLERLRESADYARARSPFYRARRHWPEIRTLEDLALLPFTTAADLIHNDPPLLALSQSEIARAVTLYTSGTGGQPKRLHFTAQDVEATVDFFHHGMATLARPGDRIAIAFPDGPPGGIYDGLTTALRRLGASPLLAPIVSGPVAMAAWLREEKPDVVAGPPVPLLAAVRVASSDGGPPLHIRSMLLSSDYAADSLANAIAAACGAEIFQHWGMTETGFGAAVDCAFHAGCHLREHELFVEVIDPATDSPAPAGALGEAVLTTLRRRGMPLIRYRTGDLLRQIEEPCACGSVLRRLSSFAGRIGAGAALPGGGVLTMPLLDEAVFAVEGVSDFTATLLSGEPAVLKLSIATPVTMSRPAVLDGVYAGLEAIPALSQAIASGELTIEATFADAIIFRHGGKRRLSTAGVTPRGSCC
jgi:phenylacetate-CoA ligase